LQETRNVSVRHHPNALICILSLNLDLIQTFSQGCRGHGQRSGNTTCCTPEGVKACKVSISSQNWPKRKKLKWGHRGQCHQNGPRILQYSSKCICIWRFM